MNKISDFGFRISGAGKGAVLRLGACVLVLMALALPAQAQRSQLSVGAQVGRPTALTIRTPAQGPVSWTGALAFDDGAAYVTVNRQYERPLQASPLNYYLAPGAYLGSARNDDLALGGNLNLGVNFYQERFEIFLQVTPAISVLPETDVWLGAAIGARFAL